MSIMSVQFKYKVDNETENKLIQEKELIIRVIVVYQKYSFQSVLQDRCSEKLQNVYRKTPAVKFYF